MNSRFLTEFIAISVVSLGLTLWRKFLRKNDTLCGQVHSGDSCHLRSYFNQVVTSDTIKENRPKRVLLIATGSIATVKVPEIALTFIESGMEVVIVLSEAARHMLYKVAPKYNPSAWQGFIDVVLPRSQLVLSLKKNSTVNDNRNNACVLAVVDDEDEWAGYHNLRTDKVLHIELRKWADVCLVAPCSANTLAKTATGLSDNLSSCILRAWDFTKPVIVAPAMNAHMWTHPVTEKHVLQLEKWGYCIVPPIEKKLACGDFGHGAMATITDIFSQLKKKLQNFNASMSQ